MPSFSDENIDGEILLDMKEEDFISMGFTFGDRKRLLKIIKVFSTEKSGEDNFYVPERKDNTNDRQPSAMLDDSTSSSDTLPLPISRNSSFDSTTYLQERTSLKVRATY